MMSRKKVTLISTAWYYKVASVALVVTTDNYVVLQT